MRSNGEMYAGTAELYTGESNAGIFLSTDNGTNWTSVGPSVNMPINCIVMDLKANLYAGTDNGIYESTNNGISWGNPALTGDAITPGALILDSDGVVFAGTNENGVYLTTNDGSVWTQIDQSQTNIYSLISGANNQVYMTSDDEVSMSTDDGLTWNLAETGLTNNFVGSFALDNEGYVYAGTEVYQGISISGVAVTTTPTPVIALHAGIAHASEVLSTYPSPFTQSESIEFQIAQSKPVSVCIYNALGKQVGNLAQGLYAPGTYTVQWDAGEFPAGIYFCRLTAGGRTAVKDLVRMQ